LGRLKPEYGLARKQMPLTSSVPSWTLSTRQKTDEFVKTHAPNEDHLAQRASIASRTISDYPPDIDFSRNQGGIAS
jgi:hypothetical protein